MRFLSMFSGIEAASVAWEPLGWKAAAFSEFEKFPGAVLAHRYPDTPNLGDVTKADFDAIGPIDLAVFGSPCQSFSVAGKRLGMDDPRGNLALVAGRIVYGKRPRWFVFENVPGLLSSDDGWDFGTLLAAYAGYPAGSVFKPPADGWGKGGVIIQADAQSYGLAWRVLDAQYFGVPQRRRRVFVVGYLGDWRRAAAVLLESHSLSGNPPPRREAGQGAAGGPDGRAAGGGEYLGNAEGGGLDAPFLTASNLGKTVNNQTPLIGSHEIVPALTASGRGTERTGESRGQDPLVVVGGLPEPHAFDARQRDVVQYGSLTGPLDTDGYSTGVLCFSSKDSGGDVEVELSPTLRAGSHDGSHANAGVPPAIAFKASHFTRGKDGAPSDVAPPLSADADKGDQDTLICQPVAFALRGREDGAVPEVEGDGDRVGALRAASGGSSRDYVAIPLLEVGKRTGESSADPRAGIGIGIGKDGDPMFTLQAGAQHGVAVGPESDAAAFTVSQNANGFAWEGDVAPTLNCGGAGGQQSGVRIRSAVRRLTPTECERLQGFPDGWTAVPFNGKPASDGPRYRALGNSMAVPCMRWIGERIAAVEAMGLDDEGSVAPDVALPAPRLDAHVDAYHEDEAWHELKLDGGGFDDAGDEAGA